jgi:hypothetical protein
MKQVLPALLSLQAVYRLRAAAARNRYTASQVNVSAHIHVSSLINSFTHSSMALQWLWPLLQFRNLFYTDGRSPWTSDQPVARPLPTHKTTQTQKKRTQTSMPRVGFEPTIPAFERAKTVHAVDRAASVILILVLSGN